MADLREGKVLVLFDFDHTLIDENSDTHIFTVLSPDMINEMREIQAAERIGWTQLMDRMLGILWHRGHSPEDLARALQTCTLHPAMLEVLRESHARGFELRIISDANTNFIDTICRHYGVAELFSHVYTNPAHLESSGRGPLRVRPYHAPELPPHGCPLCPPNLCKGSIVRSILAEGSWARIVYLGDGGGDFCPATCLRECDLLLPRESWALHEKIMKDAGASVRARLAPWSTYPGVLRIFKGDVWS